MKSLISYIVTALVSTGVLAALVTGFLRRRETRANANKIDGETLDGYAKGWKDLAEAYKEDKEAIEKRFQEQEKQMAGLRKMIEEEKDSNRLNREEIAGKNQRIAELENRVTYLESELEKAKLASQRVEEAKDTLHQSVDDNLNKLKND